MAWGLQAIAPCHTHREHLMQAIRRFALGAVFALTSSLAQAGPTIATYDLAPYTGDGTLEATSVAAGYTASAFTPSATLTNQSFDNHFYFTGWSPALDPASYLTMTLSGASPFNLEKMLFSVESTVSTASTVTVRSSQDGFASNVDSFTWSSFDTLVTDGEFDLGALGVVDGSITLRFYFTAIGPQLILGFANHEPPGSGAGLPDVGRDISFSVADAQQVPEPSGVLLVGLGLVGVGVVRRKWAARNR